MTDEPILSDIEKNNEKISSDELLPLVYDELRKLAAIRMANENPGQTLSATALVHEAYNRLVGTEETVKWDGRGHFFAAAAEAMRRILIEVARRKKGLRHGGKFRRMSLDSCEFFGDCNATDKVIDILDFDEALREYHLVYPVKAKLVELRFFAGLSCKDAADSMGIAKRTAERYWQFSVAWLGRRLS